MTTDKPLRRKVIPYKNPLYPDEFKWMDTESSRRYSGRRIFRLINRNRLRMILDAAHHPGNFKN